MEFNNIETEKKQVEIQIGNIKYNLTTNESEQYINGIAKYINNKIEEISKTYKSLNKNTAPFFLTVSLNIADDLFKQRKQFTQSSNSLKILEENFSKLNIQKSSLESLKNDLNQKDSIIKKLKDTISELEMNKNIEITSLKDENLNILSEKQLEIENLTKLYEKKLTEKDEEIQNLKNQVSNLEKSNSQFSNFENESINLLYEKDEEIENLKKQLKEMHFKSNEQNNN